MQVVEDQHQRLRRSRAPRAGRGRRGAGGSAPASVCAPPASAGKTWASSARVASSSPARRRGSSPYRYSSSASTNTPNGRSASSSDALPDSTRQPWASARASSSASSRVLPIPGSPTTSTAANSRRAARQRRVQRRQLGAAPDQRLSGRRHALRRSLTAVSGSDDQGLTPMTDRALCEDAAGMNTTHRPPLAAILVVPLIAALILTLFAWPSAKVGPRDLPVGVVGAAALRRARLRGPPLRRRGRGPRGDLGARDLRRADRFEGARGLRRLARPSPRCSPTPPTAAGRGRRPGHARVQRARRVRAPARARRHPHRRPRRPLLGGGFWRRTGLLVTGSVLTGLGATLIVQSWLDVVGGDFFANSAALSLTVLAIAATVTGLYALLGKAGIALGALTMVFIGNPFSGVATSPDMLPSGAGWLGQLLPPGRGREPAALDRVLRRRRRRRARRGARRCGRCSGSPCSRSPPLRRPGSGGRCRRRLKRGDPHLGGPRPSEDQACVAGGRSVKLKVSALRLPSLSDPT